MSKQCRSCRRFVKYLFPGDLCYECNKAEYENRRREAGEKGRREREKFWEESRQREREVQRQYERRLEREDDERRHREEMAQRERQHQEMLDATLPWFPCPTCGEKTRQDKFVEVDGIKYCDFCAVSLTECMVCHKKYVNRDGLIPLYERDEKFVKKSDKIVHKKRTYGELYKGYYGIDNCSNEIAYDKYDDVSRLWLPLCPSCYEKSLKNEKEKKKWDESRALEKAFKALDDAFYRQSVSEERKEREDWAFHKLAEDRETARKEEKSKKNMSAGCLGFMLLVAILIGFYAKGGNMGAALVLGIGAFVLSMLLRSVTSHLFVGLIFALCFEMVFGLIISVVCYFVWHAFVVPLVICFFAFLLLFTILSATGVIDKTPEGKTPFDSIGDFLDRFH